MIKIRFCFKMKALEDEFPSFFQVRKLQFMLKLFHECSWKNRRSSLTSLLSTRNHVTKKMYFQSFLS